MTPGVPGIALSGLFYILCALAMPFVELVRTLMGRSSLARWTVVLRQAGLAVFMVLAIGAVFRLVGLVPGATGVAPSSGPSAAGGGLVPFMGTWALVITLAALVGTLLVVEVAGFLVARLSRTPSLTADGEPDGGMPAPVVHRA